MCGIAGIYRLNKNTELHYQPEVLNILKHRGPDMQKHAAFDDAIFYHTRLSVLDLSEHSQQPFFLNKNKCLVFNGEIFNYKELAQHLQLQNYKGDTEVLINFFDKFKINGLHQLNGFFAFAFYDDEQDELYVVRDRFGEKPLYYYYDENVFAFSSEIFPLLVLIQKKLPLNLDVLYTYFRLHYIAGEHSILKGIQRLLPGHCIHAKNNSVSIHQWYNVKNTTPDYKISFPDLLNDAVKKRLISDAPVGAFLSGGIDSSVVCALAKNHISDLHTFSLGYTNETLYNETQDAYLVAKHIGSKHHNFEISINEMALQIPKILNNIDEPFADSSSVNVFFLTQQIKPYATVALSGDGADELLMGYHKHKVFLFHNLPVIKYLLSLSSPVISVFPESRSIKLLNSIRQLKKLSQAVQLSPFNQYLFLSQWTTDAYIHQLMRTSLNTMYFYSLFEKYRHLSQKELFNLADIEIVLGNDMLYKTDFFGMQNAVEIRSPFLDHRVVEYIFHSPFEHKIYRHQQKYLLKKHFSHLLPPSVFSKKKKGFEIPLHKILHLIISNDDLMSKDFIESQKLFNYSTIQQLTEQLKNNINDSALKLWAIFVFQHWHKRFEKFIQTV